MKNINKYLVIKDKAGKVIQKIDIEEQFNAPPPFANSIDLDGKGSTKPHTIDLSALSNYRQLVYLRFRNYPNLEVPNLYPLYNNKNLQGIHVQDDCPQMVEGEWDITPLFEVLDYHKMKSHFSKLSSDYLKHHSVRSLPKKYFIGFNVTVWLHPEDFEIIKYMNYSPENNPTDHDLFRDLNIQYKPLEEIKDWGQIRRLLWEVKGRTCHITAQHSILNGLGLSHYGFIEADLMNDLLSVSRDFTVDETRREFEPVLVERVCSQIDQKRTTIGLVIDDELLDNKEFAKRLPQILELRKHEIERIQVPVIRGSVHWQSLYFTAYGYHILNSFGRGIYQQSNRDSIFNAFSDSGINLQTREFDSPRDGVDFAQQQLDNGLVSETLRNYIRLLPHSLFPAFFS